MLILTHIRQEAMTLYKTVIAPFFIVIAPFFIVIASPFTYCHSEHSEESHRSGQAPAWQSQGCEIASAFCAAQ
jgi:hypothetical protein